MLQAVNRQVNRSSKLHVFHAFEQSSRRCTTTSPGPDPDPSGPSVLCLAQYFLMGTRSSAANPGQEEWVGGFPPVSVHLQLLPLEDPAGLNKELTHHIAKVQKER